MGSIACFLGSGVAGRIVLAFVQAQMLWSLLGGLRTADHNGVDSNCQQWRVDCIGSADSNP